jgi:hypothetical protein
MKSLFTLSLVAVIAFSCKLSSKAPIAVHITPIDSLKVTIDVSNLSEDVSGNDEVLILCYLDTDTLNLNAPMFLWRLNFPSKNSSRQFNIKLKQDVTDKPLLLFVLEQDSDLPAQKIDSILRVSHLDIRKLFVGRNYTGIEKYLEDEDILGIKSISKLNCPEPFVVSLLGIYKLDRYEYLVKLECP